MTVKVDNNACDRCGTCIGVCRVNALLLRGGPVIVDEDLCTACGTCVMICPFGALSLPRPSDEGTAKGGPHV